MQERRPRGREPSVNPPPSRQEIPNYDDFRRNPDGSWTTTRPSRITNPAGYEICLTSNMTFHKGKGLNMMGFDLVELLEKHCK